MSDNMRVHPVILPSSGPMRKMLMLETRELVDTSYNGQIAFDGLRTGSMPLVGEKVVNDCVKFCGHCTIAPRVAAEVVAYGEYVRTTLNSHMKHSTGQERAAAVRPNLVEKDRALAAFDAARLQCVGTRELDVVSKVPNPTYTENETNALGRRRNRRDSVPSTLETTVHIARCMNPAAAIVRQAGLVGAPRAIDYPQLRGTLSGRTAGLVAD